MKHTPGPWVCMDQDASVWSDDGEGLQIAHCMSKPGCGMITDMEQCRANARMIAAAPELLELVKAAFQWIDAVPKNTPLPSMPGLDRDWANSIIAKAEAQ